MSLTFYEFFAGGGMARVGLGDAWTCLFANDIDPLKSRAYAANHGSASLLVEDAWRLTTTDLPGCADLAWASFPCQDLSLAGAGAGLRGGRSKTFWAFWRLIRNLDREGRAPRVIALENVSGVLTANGGRDFAAIASAFSGRGYRFGALVIDAVKYVPQSRPRVFVLGVRKDVSVPSTLRVFGPTEFHPPAMRAAQARLSSAALSKWIWWRMDAPPPRNYGLGDLVEDEPCGVAWHAEEDTQYILSLMSPRNRAKVEMMRSMKRRVVGGVYRRTRPGGDGGKTQRAEVRFDDVAGCLRTPEGGSSRQTILVVDGPNVRSRLLSPREAARLMGLPDDYLLPDRYNDAYHLLGDGVVAPVVRHIADAIIEPLLERRAISSAA